MTTTTISRAKVRNALKRGGVPVGHRSYGDVASIEEFIDYWGISAGIPGTDATKGHIVAALTAAGLPFEQGNYIMIPRKVGS